MTIVRKLAAVTALLGLLAVISSGLQGQAQPKKPANAAATPQVSAARKVSQLAEAADSRFALPGLLTYQPVQGDLYFAMQLQPKLDALPVRPRDILILMSTAATQAGPGWVSAHQIAEGVIETAHEFDRIALMTVNSPENTRSLTKDFLSPKDYAEGKRLRAALLRYRNEEYPSGDTDLKNALALAVKAFDAGKDRQRIVLFLGDGLSTHNPLSNDDRLALSQQMVERKIGFFPVPLGIQLDPATLHGLASSTGGAILRTKVDSELLIDALKRYEQAFAGPVLYGPKLQLPAEVSAVCPTTLPPLRTDTPTLVVGRMKKAPARLDYSLAGTLAGRKGEITLKAFEPIQPANLDNYFLVSMVDQWRKAPAAPALLRADRALGFAYEQARLQHLELLDNAQLALQENKIDAAGRLFQQARQLAPHDGEAQAGIKIVDRLKDGTLTRDAIRKQLAQRKVQADELKFENGKAHWIKVNLQEIVQKDDKAPANLPLKKLPDLGREDLLKEHRDRQAVEEQKISQAVEDAIRLARRNLPSDPDGTLDLLKNLLSRVKDHPDLGAAMRDTLSTRLQASLRDSAQEAQRLQLRKRDATQAAQQTQANLVRDQERKTFIERVESQLRVYKNLMNTARYEETAKMAILEAMMQMQEDARLKGQDVPVASKAMYDISLAAYPLQQHQSLVRQRERQWLSVLMEVEKSHIPYPDEPTIHFPPLRTWKALIKARKGKYEVTSLPDDPEGRAESSEIQRLLNQPIKVKGLQEKVKLKQALEYFSDKFGGKLSIIVDKEAFSAANGADAPDIYEEEVQLPPAPDTMVMSTALRLVLAQVGKGKATYLIRRSFVEITTMDNYLDDKVLRIYPVGDLVMPLSQPLGVSMGMMRGGMGGQMMGGGMMGQMMGGMGGQMMGGMGGQMMGGMGGGMNMMGMGGGMNMMGMGGGMNMMGMGGMGMGGGMNMMGMGGMGMGGGMNMMGMGGMGMGGGMNMMGMGGGMNMMGMGGGMNMMGMGGMGMGGMGMGGMGMGGMGMGGMMPGQFTGGAFQGSFNGSLGVMGATQATGLISVITSLVDPGNWNQPPQNNPLAMMMQFPGFMMGMQPGMVGNPPPAPDAVQPDPKTSNTINFFPPSMALIVRAPSRMHTSITGGIIGGARAKQLEKAGAFLNQPGNDKVLAQNPPRNPNIKVAPAQGADNAQIALKKKDLDPTKVWNEGFAKGGASPGMVIATADFLFEAGEFKHAAEFLKANLRYGVVVRPWVFEALAVALEVSGGNPEDVRRARLSGIALDPQDAQGFLSAARAMADRGQPDRALAFCRQAALLEPNDYHPYEVALAYAESAKDGQAMAWAVGKLVSQDWPVDNLFLHSEARQRLNALATKLKSEQRPAEAKTLQEAVERLNQRDLIVKLQWDTTGAPAELEMKVKEPTGSVCSLEQKQTPGGGILIGYHLTDKEPHAQYVVAEGFNGVYEITVDRIYGQPLGNRARLEIVQNAGTPQQTRRLEIIRLDQNAPIKITLKGGRRTELATVAPGANQRHAKVQEEKASNTFRDLRALANPSFFGASGPYGGASTPGAQHIPSVASMAARDSKHRAPVTMMQNAVPGGAGVAMTSQLRMSADQQSMDMVVRPFFQSVTMGTNRPAINLSGIPGGEN